MGTVALIVPSYGRSIGKTVKSANKKQRKNCTNGLSPSLFGNTVTMGSRYFGHQGNCDPKDYSFKWYVSRHDQAHWYQGARIACWKECWTRAQKVASSNPSRSGGRIFFPWVNSVCWLLLGVCSTQVLSQWHVKDPGHSAKSAGGRLRVRTHTSLTKWSQSGLTMLLSRHSVGTYPEMSSHATCQGTFSHSCLSSLSHCGLIVA